jgi:hypothetical protein
VHHPKQEEQPGATAARIQAMLVQAPQGLPEAAPVWDSMITRVVVIADPVQFGFRHKARKGFSSPVS